MTRHWYTPSTRLDRDSVLLLAFSSTAVSPLGGIAMFFHSYLYGLESDGSGEVSTVRLTLVWGRIRVLFSTSTEMLTGRGEGVDTKGGGADTGPRLLVHHP